MMSSTASFWPDGSLVMLPPIAAPSGMLTEGSAARALVVPLCLLVTSVARCSQAISFGAADMETGSVVTVDVDLVRERVGDMLVQSDLSKYII